MSTTTGALRSTRPSMLSSRKGTGPTKFGLTAATAQRTLSAIHRCEHPAIQWMKTALWLAVIASGVYHGVSPGMGWPLAVSAGLMGKSPRAVFLALWPLSVGHFLASLLVLLP